MGAHSKQIGIIKERRLNEKRVAATPDTVKKFIAMGLNVNIEKGAGITAAITDHAVHSSVFFPSVGAGIVGCGIQTLVLAGTLVQPDCMEVSLVVRRQVDEGVVSD